MKGAHTFPINGTVKINIHCMDESFHYGRTGPEKNRIVLSFQHSHPLANSAGKISAAKYILYAKKRNPRWTACDCCGYGLMWKNPNPRRAIYASFDDSDPSNLTWDNIVALCCWCNIGRAWGKRYPEAWAEMVEEHKLTPPFERENPLTLLKEMGLKDPRTLPRVDRLEWKAERGLTPWTDGAAGRVKATGIRLRKEQIKPARGHSKEIETVLHDLAIRLSRCTGGRFDVDHIVPLSKGGPHHHSNLRVIPKHLNAVKHGRSDSQCSDIGHLLNVWSVKWQIGRN